MVKKKVKRKVGRRNLNSTSKEIAAGCEGLSSKALTPHDEPGEDQTTALSLDVQRNVQGLLGFPDRVYLLASVIFHNNLVVKPATHRLVNYGIERELSLPEIQDEVMQLSVYELAFNTLKYQELLEEILVDCCLCLPEPMLEDGMRLVAVMLYDFQDRKFLPRGRTENQETIQEVRDVENYLLLWKTKLAASFARSRIKHDLLSMECILPTCVRKKQERSRSLPLYAWVNRLKISDDEVQDVLKNNGLLQVKSIRQLSGQTFCEDSHCWDTLVFPAQLKAPPSFTKLLREHKLIIQDKSCILPPNAVAGLLPEEGDVLMVGCFSGPTVAHTASLIAEKYERNKNNKELPTVYVCAEDISERQREELQRKVYEMGCKNVKLLPQLFPCLDVDDKRLWKVRVILLFPRSSMSAVSNTVQFILQENGDTGLLQDLARGAIAQSKLEDLATQQRKHFDHALKFPQVSVVVYCTCSSYQEENEDVVNHVLQRVKASSDQEGDTKSAHFRPRTFHFSSSDQPGATNETFFTLEPSELNNGCFLAVLMREQPDPVVKEAPEEILTRANTKGILETIGSNHRPKKHNHNRTSKGHTHASLAKQLRSISLRNQPQTSSSSSSSSINVQHSNIQQPPQVKPKGLHFQPVKKSAAVTAFRDSKLKHSTSSAPSSDHPESDKPIKTMSHTLNISSSVSRAAPLHPSAPPTPPVAPVLRQRRAQAVLKPVVLVLPPLYFPTLHPPRHPRSGVNHVP